MQNNTFSTLFVGQNLIRLSIVDSTNNFLKMMMSNSEPVPEGTVIMADEQYAGRGQQENVWHAEPGQNLTISLLLKPGFLAVDQQFLLNMVICIAIRNSLKTLIPNHIAIKWPNDIYYLDKKVGGVLIENGISGNQYKSAVVGIGINVNQMVFNSEAIKNAASIRQILQEDVNLISLLSEICNHIEAQYLRLRRKTDDLTEDYMSGLYKFGQRSVFRDISGEFWGIIENVTSSGKLILNTAEGKRTYNFKEIEFIAGNV